MGECGQHKLDRLVRVHLTSLLLIFPVDMFGVGAVLGAALASLLGHHYGRRLCLMTLAVMDLLGWLVMATSTNLGMLVGSRFLSGCAGGGYMLCVQVYVGEISQTHQRAWLLALSAPITALGILTMYVSSGLLPWHCAAASCLPVPAALAIVMIFYWDTPPWLATSSRPQLVRAALAQYRGQDYVELELEINKVLQHQQHSGLSTVRIVRNIFKEKRYFKPFLILNSLNLLGKYILIHFHNNYNSFLVLLCGKFAVDYYSVEVFVRFGSDLSLYVAELVAALLTLVGSLMLLPLVRWMSRKSLLSLSSAVMAVSLLLLGFCSYSHSQDMELLRDCDWLPITCVVSYIMATNMGLSALPNIFISEFYPSHVSHRLQSTELNSFENISDEDRDGRAHTHSRQHGDPGSSGTLLCSRAESAQIRPALVVLGELCVRDDVHLPVHPRDEGQVGGRDRDQVREAG